MDVPLPGTQGLREHPTWWKNPAVSAILGQPYSNMGRQGLTMTTCQRDRRTDMCSLESPDACDSLGGGSCRVCCPDGPCAHSWLLLGDPVARSVHHPHWALFPISIHVIPLCWPSTHLLCNEIKCGHPGSSVRSCEGLPMSSVPSQRGSVQGLYQGPGAPLTLASGSMAWPHSRTGKMRGLELTPVLGWSLLSLLYTYNPDKNILLKATFLFLHPTVLSLRPNDVSLCYNNLGNLQMWHRLEPSPHIIAK